MSAPPVPVVTHSAHMPVEQFELYYREELHHAHALTRDLGADVVYEDFVWFAWERSSLVRPRDWARAFYRADSQ